MILRNRGAKTPLLSVDLTPARVALNLRERGAVFPCKWCSVAEIYKLDGRKQELVQKSAALNVKIVSPEQVKEIYGYLDT